jgi:hypothetical protein
MMLNQYLIAVRKPQRLESQQEILFAKRRPNYFAKKAQRWLKL